MGSKNLTSLTGVHRRRDARHRKRIGDLSADLLTNLWNNRNDSFSDLTLVSSDHYRINVHRAILAGRSGFFKKLLNSPPSGSGVSHSGGAERVDVGEVNVNIRGDVMLVALKFLYSGDVELLSEDNPDVLLNYVRLLHTAEYLHCSPLFTEWSRDIHTLTEKHKELTCTAVQRLVGRQFEAGLDHIRTPLAEHGRSRLLWSAAITTLLDLILSYPEETLLFSTGPDTKPEEGIAPSTVSGVGKGENLGVLILQKDGLDAVLNRMYINPKPSEQEYWLQLLLFWKSGGKEEQGSSNAHAQAEEILSGRIRMADHVSSEQEPVAIDATDAVEQSGHSVSVPQQQLRPRSKPALDVKYVRWWSKEGAGSDEVDITFPGRYINLENVPLQLIVQGALPSGLFLKKQIQDAIVVLAKSNTACLREVSQRLVTLRDDMTKLGGPQDKSSGRMLFDMLRSVDDLIIIADCRLLHDISASSQNPHC